MSLEKKWIVDFDEDFKKKEFDNFPKEVRLKILEMALVLQGVGPELGRPLVDTLYDSKHANMKELRFNLGDETWRVAFAFDTERKALLLTAGDKSGVNQKRFYKKLIKTADARFDAHLEKLKGKDR
ncbi:addiction module toxin RelE [Roseovarius sp. A21]|uniref:Addiction module toxin RelE n=1 Tax=Roseovarius bejariae TaxID=2576383 RepID=A0A844D4J0_9RHOB|nr:type II toxin-antitoxin system RelE/ParE family toxin [Roseovarius bejariae]MRU17074.1 addiction module toxin RelE [Roseovarius bejariae]